MELRKIFKEFRKRKVYQVAITYAITAWLLSQVTSIAATSFEAPSWVMKMIITFLVIGFPIALVLAWAFELTPNGIVKTTSLNQDKNQEPPTSKERSKRAKWLAGSSIGVFLLLLLYFNMGGSYMTSASSTIKSIAVLPFDSYSKQQEHQFFAEAIADEIRSQLLSVNGLKVVSGYSSKYYKGQNVSSKQVGDELSVEYILQGNVQQIANTAKVTVELSHTQSNSLEWSPPPFERKMENLFQLENEIAQQIVNQLKVRLSAEEQKELKTLPTKIPEAYQLFLQGQELLHRNRANTTEMDQAIELFKQAISLDPTFDRAYMGLAEGYIELSLWGRIPTKEGLNEALNAIFSVHDITSAEYVGILGAINFYRREIDLAKKFLERSLEMNSNYQLAQVRLAWIKQFEGQTEEAIALVDAAQTLDPKDPIYYGFKGFILYYNNEFEEGIAIVKDGLIVHPENNWLKWVMGYIYSGMGEYDKAIEVLVNRSVAHQTNWMIGYCYGKIGETEKARSVLEYLLNRRQQGHVPAHMIASVYIGLGENEEALDWLEIDVKEGGHEHFYWGMKDDIKYDPLRGEERFHALLEEIDTDEKLSDIE